MNCCVKSEKKENDKRIRIIVYYPGTMEQIYELRKRVGSVHANAVMSHVRKLNCSHEQKLKLLNSVIEWQRGHLRVYEPPAQARKGRKYTC